jgi:SIR2-like domain
MSVNVHNPDQYMASLRQVIGQGRKRVGLLIGAGGPASIPAASGTGCLIPATEQLTEQVLAALAPTYGSALHSIKSNIANPNIEMILSRVRSLAGVIGTTEVNGLDGAGHAKLADAICAKIGLIVDRPLPAGSNAYVDLINWISGTDRDNAVEIFTTNYDLLFEQALERGKVSYFDGFTGASEPFFDPSTVSGNDLPPRWVRLWKLHGSLGWKLNHAGEVIRIGDKTATHLVFPEHLKYDQTQKAPYTALFDRLRSFLMTSDTLLIVSGFSFADAHISALIEECLAANPSASVFAFQFKALAEEQYATLLGARRANLSVYARDQAIINGLAAPWQPGDPPTRDWGPIRATYWDSSAFLLGSFDNLARFFVASRSVQVFPSPSPVTASVS